MLDLNKNFESWTSVSAIKFSAKSLCLIYEQNFRPKLFAKMYLTIMDKIIGWNSTKSDVYAQFFGNKVVKFCFFKLRPDLIHRIVSSWCSSSRTGPSAPSRRSETWCGKGQCWQVFLCPNIPKWEEYTKGLLTRYRSAENSVTRRHATKLEAILSVVACCWRHKATDIVNTPNCH
jgi:hypothetical protein